MNIAVRRRMVGGIVNISPQLVTTVSRSVVSRPVEGRRSRGSLGRCSRLVGVARVHNPRGAAPPRHVDLVILLVPARDVDLAAVDGVVVPAILVVHALLL